jgi:hypothetical protein
MKPGVSLALTVLLPICLPNSETCRREFGGGRGRELGVEREGEKEEKKCEW